MSSIRVVHLSDLHFRRQYEEWGFQSLLSKLPDALENLNTCLEQEKKRGMDLVLLTGDLSHDGTPEDYAILRETLDRILGGIPWIALPGNHDSREAFQAEIQARRTDVRGDAVDWIGGLRVISLDSGMGIAGVLSESQTRWLREVLSSPSENGTLLALHHPMIPDQEGLGTMKMDNELPNLIAKSDVIGILCGHTHRNYTGTFAGKPYVTADSLSYVMEEAGPNTCLKAVSAYNRVVFGEGTFSVQVQHLAPAPAVAACFPTDTMSALFQTRK